MSGKKPKKHVFVTMEQKLIALKRLDAGQSAKKIAQDFNVGKSTVGDWKKNRKEIEQWCTTQASTSGIKKRKTMKKGGFEELSEALFLWFVQNREKGVPISGPLLKEKALQFYKDLGNEDKEFCASEGWLEKWKLRHGVRQLQVSGERLSADEASVTDFKSDFQNVIDKEGLSGEQLYNCDETGLNFKMLPTKTLASRQEDAAPGHKKKKERVTILACSNATGQHKLKLLMIGKSKNPRAFKKINEKALLPVNYTNQSSAWMNSTIFKDWFFGKFVPSVERHLKENNLPRKALLILDNAPTHPSVEDLTSGDIKCMFLPPNVTSICQPMDQGVLEALKKKYRRKLMSVLISNIDEGNNMKDSLKKIDILDVVNWISQSWEEVEPVTLVRSWRKLLDHKADNYDPPIEDDNPSEDSDNNELVQLLHGVSGCEDISSEEVNEWVNSDETEELTDSDIIEMVTNSEENEDPDYHGEGGHESESTITHGDAFKAIDSLIHYVEHQEEATPADILLFRRWRDVISRKRCDKIKQIKITSFFKK